ISNINVLNSQKISRLNSKYLLNSGKFLSSFSIKLFSKTPFSIRVIFQLAYNGLVYEKCEYIKPMFRKGTNKLKLHFVWNKVLKAFFIYIVVCSYYLTYEWQVS